MIPSKPLIYLIAIWTIASLGLFYFPMAQTAWLGVAIVLVIFAAIDMIQVLQILKPEIQREVSLNLAHGETTRIKLFLKNNDSSELRVQIFDDIPDNFQYDAMPIAVSLESNEVNRIEYFVKPLQRGNACFRKTTLRIQSPLRLWFYQYSINNENPVRVYPNFSSITKFTLLGLDNRESAMGVQQKRMRGEGLEFHQLREYRVGDSLRQIDWKASIRLQKMISREYQQERDQKIIFLLDCGRRMAATDGEYSHFDEALNSLLLLGYVALRQGDAVGLQCFGGDDRFLPPSKGLATINRLLNFSYDLSPKPEAPDYMSAVKNLLKREKRRSLVIWLTNLRDDDAEELKPTIQLLRKHHLVLVANLKETFLDKVEKSIPSGFEEALTISAATEFKQRRTETLSTLSHQGAVLVDTIPSLLPSSLVNAYLEIKASGKL